MSTLFLCLFLFLKDQYQQWQIIEFLDLLHLLRSIKDSSLAVDISRHQIYPVLGNDLLGLISCALVKSCDNLHILHCGIEEVPFGCL